MRRKVSITFFNYSIAETSFYIIMRYELKIARKSQNSKFTVYLAGLIFIRILRLNLTVLTFFFLRNVCKYKNRNCGLKIRDYLFNCIPCGGIELQGAVKWRKFWENLYQYAVICILVPYTMKLNIVYLWVHNIYLKPICQPHIGKRK